MCPLFLRFIPQALEIRLQTVKQEINSLLPDGNNQQRTKLESTLNDAAACLNEICTKRKAVESTLVVRQQERLELRKLSLLLEQAGNDLARISSLCQGMMQYKDIEKELEVIISTLNHSIRICFER